MFFDFFLFLIQLFAVAYMKSFLSFFSYVVTLYTDHVEFLIYSLVGMNFGCDSINTAFNHHIGEAQHLVKLKHLKTIQHLSLER